MKTKIITYQDQNIFYRVTGNGKPVVLLHGFGEDGDIWERQVEFLKEHFTLIIPDLPGSGRSALLPITSIESLADCIKAILDEEQINRCNMIGHSMGGYIILAFAKKYPGSLNIFGLFHSSAFADTEEKKEARRRSIEFIKENGAFAFLKTAIPGLFSETFKKEYPGKVNSLVEKGKSFTGEALVHYYEAMIARHDRTDVLRNFPNPILFIMGEFDNAIPLQSSLQQCYLPVQSHIHILQNSAHMGMWEETAKANDILFNFLNTTI